MPQWTTQIDRTITEHFGAGPIHSAWFVPPDWVGHGSVVSLGIPECELQIVVLGSDGEPVVTINRPQKNMKVKYWLRCACEEAVNFGACLMLACDTPAQVERAAQTVARHLPHYKRLALERFYASETRSDRGLN